MIDRLKVPVISALKAVGIIIIFSAVRDSELEVAYSLWHGVVLVQIPVEQGIVFVTIVTGLIGLIPHGDE